MSSPKLRLAVIGLGHLHPRAYMPLFEAQAGLEVTAAYDPDAARRAAFCQDYGLTGYATLDQLLEAEPLDLAAIFLPHADCEAAAVRCAAQGLHLMIEKPMAHQADAAARIVQAARQQGVKLTTGYCWRYHPVVTAMREALAQGAVGRVVSVEARLAAGRVGRYLEGGAEWMLQKARSGGGPLMNLGVHWIDLLQFLLGDRIAEVCARHGAASDAYDIEDHTAALLRFANGVAGVLTTSYVVPDCFPNGRDLYIGIKGTHGTLSYAPGYEGESGSSAAGQTDVLECYSDAPALAGAGVRRLAFQLDRVPGYSGYMGQAYVANFVAMIQDQAPPMITPDEALSVLRVVAAMYRSGETRSWEAVCA
ncbi:MAG: Gfo/Idh/MocA family oxidoreductase [Candidatus Marinimicrobia bacterium]|nr:Gfo/Idh/MocA family oxidoreductase [Candidatus Neomarinimicrobiota bacterium]